jgi:hypothetical protein
VLSWLDRHICAMQAWLYWSLLGMLAAVVVAALIVITIRVLMHTDARQVARAHPF